MVNKLREIHRDQYFLGRVTIGVTTATDPSKIPEEYRRHAKVFSEEESQ
jgi:hypothetical protein